MTVPTWAFLDFTAPLCYVADAALRRLEGEDRMEVHHRAAEMFPAPEGPPPVAAAEWEEVEPLAAALGLPLLPPAFRPHTAKAHEAVLLAGEHGLATPMRAAIFAAFFAEGRDIGRIDVLVEVGERVGVDASALKAGLDVDRWSARVAQESAESRRLGVVQLPVIVVGGAPEARVVSGAQSYESLRTVLDAPA